jgi:hypothetical protein
MLSLRLPGLLGDESIGYAMMMEAQELPVPTSVSLDGVGRSSRGFTGGFVRIDEVCAHLCAVQELLAQFSLLNFAPTI